MKKVISSAIILLSAVSYSASCEANTTTFQSPTPVPSDAVFLDSEELQSLHSDKTLVWKQIRDGKEGQTFFHANGTFSMVGQGKWEVRENGVKCNIFGNKEFCATFSRTGDKYIGTALSGDEKFEFTVINDSTNQAINIMPAEGDRFSSSEVTQLFSGNTVSWQFINKDQKGQTTYYTNGKIGRPAGTWTIKPKGIKCQTRNDNKKTSCGKIYHAGSQYFLADTKEKKTFVSFIVQ